MTLLETIRTIETIALQQAAVHTVVENDVFKLNDMPNVKYGVFAFTQGQHTSTTEGAFTTYGFSLFYIDRLNEDRSNQIQIQSTGERTLRNILLILADQGIESSQYTIQPFNQRFADECAGVYCDVSLSVPNDSTCPDWVPAIPPQDIITREDLDKALSKSTIRVDRYQDFTAEEQTRALANAGAGIVILDELPAGTVVSSELGNQLADCAAIVVKVAPNDGGSQLFRRVKTAVADGIQVTTFEALSDEHSIYKVTVRVDSETLAATSTVETLPLGEGGGSLPAGGTAGQVLTKTTDGAAWQDAPAGGALPFKIVEVTFPDASNQKWLTEEEYAELRDAAMLVIKNSILNYNYGNENFPPETPIIMTRTYRPQLGNSGYDIVFTNYSPITGDSGDGRITCASAGLSKEVITIYERSFMGQIAPASIAASISDEPIVNAEESPIKTSAE